MDRELDGDQVEAIDPSVTVYRLLPDVTRGAGFVTVAKLLGALAGIAATAAISRSVDTEQVGTYFALVSLALTVSTFATLGVPATSARLIGLAMHQPDTPRAEVPVVWKAVVIASLGGLVASLATVALGWVSQGLTYAMVVGLLILLMSIRRAGVQALRSVFRVPSAATWADVFPRFALLVALIAIGSLGHRMSLDSLILITVVVWVLAAIGPVAELVIRVGAGRPYSTPSLGEYLSLGVPWLASVGLVFALTEAAPIGLAAMSQPAEAALYGVSARVAAWLTVPLAIVTSTLPPHLVRLMAAADTDRLSKLLMLSASIAAVPVAVGTLAVALWGDRILALLFGVEYAGAAPALLALAVGHLAAAAAGPCALFLSLADHKRELVLITGSVVPLAVLAVLGGSIWSGSTGAGIAVAAGLVVLNASYSLAAKRVAGVRTWASLSPRRLRNAARTLAQR